MEQEVFPELKPEIASELDVEPISKPEAQIPN